MGGSEMKCADRSPMDIHFVTSAKVAVRQRTIFKRGGGSKIDIPVRYGVVRHPTIGPIIIDAGYAPSLYNAPGASMALRAYRAILKPAVFQDGNPQRACRKLGFLPEDVKHVILTHLHADHVGYLASFPNAQIHVSASCIDELVSKGRFQLAHHGIFPELLPADFLSRISPFPERQTYRSHSEMTPHTEANVKHVSTPLGEGADIFGYGDVIAVPLPGHATGHIGLWLPNLSTPLFYATDTTWTMEGLMNDAERPLAVSIASVDGNAARAQRAKVRQFVLDGGRVALCHDPRALPEDIPLSEMESALPPDGNDQCCPTIATHRDNASSAPLQSSAQTAGASASLSSIDPSVGDAGVQGGDTHD
jgi:glyoxylase-like metal-dependent hydrolase (beta-lactamase superfamily II)